MSRINLYPQVTLSTLQCFTGPYCSIEEKERISLIKALQTIQHPYIAPVQYCAATNAGAMFIRPYMEKGSLLDQIYKVHRNWNHSKQGSPNVCVTPWNIPSSQTS